MLFINEKSKETTFEFFTKLCEHLTKMETQKTVNLLNSSENKFSKFPPRKWYVINSESKGNYSHESPIKGLKKSIESSLYDYSDAYVLVTGNIAVGEADNNTKVALKMYTIQKM